uniref:Protein kinase domain-containing protein n=1 Tax=Tanacetum cinerariifolium TaxID=118510 RepID=A0A699HRX0_TANCI|nr:hypothetical protein [Tanacetum cinerariifolium]
MKSKSFGIGLKKLVSFDVSQNNLFGVFPSRICDTNGIKSLVLHTNSFNGSLVNTLVAKCLSRERLELQNNGFHGYFPSSVWSLPRIKIYRAENNRFLGEIPDSISIASQLEQVQIDNNSFISKIPHGLGLVKSLYRFSASLNGFSIPELTECKKLVSLSLAGLPALYLEGNPDLCGSGLPNSCPTYDSKRMIGISKLSCVLISLAFVVGILIIENDLIMSMDEKASRGSHGAFDIGQNQTREYSKNLGVLGFSVGMELRLKIAIGIVQGLAYLHKDYVPHLLHRDVKSRNVLLDNDFQPKLTNLALDTILGENAFQSSLDSKSGSSCYDAEATEQMDTYVILLELVTGRPT